MKLTARETVVFAMLGAVMYASKVVMEFAPNIHLLGALTIAYTVVYRKKALYPIYTYVILNVYMILCAAHGFLFGTLYAPAQAILYGLSFQGMIAWIIAGLPWDFIHGISNFFCGILIVPIISVLRMAERKGTDTV